MNLEFFVKDKRITRKGFQPVVADTSGHYTFTVEFDREWDDLTKVVVFQNGDETAELIYTGKTWLPDNVSKKGDLYVACHGYKNPEVDSVAVIRTVRMTRPVRILESGLQAGGDPERYTPSVFEQVMAAAASANQAREQLMSAWENGTFNGRAATVEIGTVETGAAGSEAAVTNGGTATDVKLNFVLPRGEQGPAGKNAFQYAQEGGYTGSETDFRAKMSAALPAVSYTQFGAKLDGVSDDTQAAILCHAYANATGCRVEQHSGTLYLKTATEQSCPLVKTSCDWSGMTFRIDESMGKHILMQVVPDAGIQTHSLTSDEIAQLEKGTTQVPFLAEYKNCICHFTTDIFIGNRLNKTESYVYHETVTVDRYGNLLDGPLFRGMTDAGSVTMEYQSILEPPITLKGARIVLDTTDDAQIPCFLVKRSNTTLEGWTFVVQKETSSDSTDYKGEILKAANCYNLTIEKFAGENFGTFFSGDAANKAQTCYLLYLSGLSRFTLRDCVLLRAWGVVQSQFCKDMAFRDSTLGRIDNHYGCRNYTVSNCTMATSHSVINIGFGDGLFLIDNVRFVKAEDPDTTFQNSCVFLRSDFCALFSGELVIRDVTIRNDSGQSVNLLNGGYTDSWDFGDSGAILPLEFPEVKISHVVYDRDNVTMVNFRVDGASYPVQHGLPIQAKLVDISDVKCVGAANHRHLRVAVHYGYTYGVAQADRFGIRMRIPWKCEWITNVSGSILAQDCHINNFNGSVGATLQLENCYVYSNATNWQYVRNMVLRDCHIYIGSNSTVKFNCNHSIRFINTVFEERVAGTKFEALDIPELYSFQGCRCISSVLDKDMARKLLDSDTIQGQTLGSISGKLDEPAEAGTVGQVLTVTDQGNVWRDVSANLTLSESYVEWTYDELSAGTEKTFPWGEYLLLLITTGNYSNIYESTLVPVSEFANTTSTHRPILCWGSSNTSVYKTGDSTIYAATTNISGNQRLRVYGLIRIS